ncbi:ATP-dependent DNA helicase [Candidatus Nanosyncoccus alces]|uniref:DNA 3'-5' helicase n=1 Tax=Candidatus Nanosyncoccus alces TaxID=2171997 RepID=A0ABY0FL08_9BACT|nr:ATP-dependent DNA helicase [Candidatus Nanosyncoccus alces]RYC74397.1 ATP-dependent DNA helicase PcrA [Candidatus Nanosyncoccus alces]
MGLNARQREAVEYLAGPLLVLAGPGTGKTQLLSEKVAYILKNTDTNPENILCLTFTETGAANMRERLKSIVGKDGLKVNIGTYHAFGTDILTQYKNYAEDYDRKLDSAIDEVTQFKIVREIQSGLSGRDILRGDNVKDIISVISAAKSAGLSADDLQRIAEQNLEDSKVLSEAISPLLANIVPRAFRESYDKAYQPIYEILANYIEVRSILPTVERSIAGLARDLKTAMIEAETSEKIKPLSSWKDKYFEKDEKGNYRLKDRVANKKLASLARIMGDYDEYLRKNGLYDFDDMIEEAVRILKTDRGFRLTLQERYQFIMLDEFQDTNPSQFMIIKQLTDYEKPMIMAVGDDDQAIYEFQGALSTNLTDFQAHYSANVIPLVENYRSTQEILDFSRKIIGQAADRFADKELIAHKPAPADTQIYRHEFLSSDMEYDFVAREIARLIKKGVKQDEIAVISYKTKYFMPLLPFLKSHPEIKIAYEKRDNLFEDEIVHEIFTLARFVHEIASERNENTSILEILSYPFFELPMLEVIRLVGQARKDHESVFEVLGETENVKIKQVAEWLANLVAKSFTEPLEIMLNYIIGAAELGEYCSPLLKYYSDKGEYSVFTLYENLAALNGKLRKHFGEKSLRLGDLITMMDDYEAAEMTLNKTSPYKDADEAVQILTAHKAKGLEFKYVFIVSADHVAWGKGKGNNNLLVLPKNLAQIRHTGITDGEKLRILYVALTRAKETLYITNSLHDFNDKSPDRLEYLGEYLDDDKVVSPLIPAGNVFCHYEASASASSENAETLKHWLTPYTKPSPDMRALYKERVKNWRMSASSLTSFIDIVYAGPMEFFKRQILRAPVDPETEALAFGDLVHKTFEAVTNRKISNEEAIKYFLTELDKKDLSSETMQKIREKGPADLTVSLEKFGKILRQGKAEVNLAPEKLSIDGVPVTGKIDHIVVDDTAKTIEIYDFKTGGYHKEKWRSHATLYKYMLQLGFYKLLLNNSPTYKKYKVERAHILFVTPDKDEEVYDKVYEFNDTDEKELIELMRAIYNAVESLEFMDDAEIFRPGDNTLGLKDIKNFVDKLLER